MGGTRIFGAPIAWSTGDICNVIQDMATSVGYSDLGLMVKRGTNKKGEASVPTVNLPLAVEQAVIEAYPAGLPCEYGQGSRVANISLTPSSEPTVDAIELDDARVLSLDWLAALREPPKEE